jgi:CheY-like chemotaxis protein
LNQKILVADDSALIRTLLRKMFEQSGDDVTEAEDGAAAVKQLEAMTPDLAMVDLLMPGMDGFALITWMRQQARFQNTPIVAMSSLEDSGSRSRAAEAGATRFLAKPISAKEIWLILARLGFTGPGET